MGVGSGDGIDVNVVLKNVLEHGSRFASFNVDSHLFVHLFGVHFFEGIVESIGIKVSTGWHGNKSWCSVIGKIEEDFGVLIRLENWSTGRGVTSKDSNDVVGNALFSFVVNFAAGVNIDSWSSGWGWLVEKSSWEGVHGVVGNIVV